MRRLLVATLAATALIAGAGCGTTTAEPIGEVQLSAAQAMQETAKRAEEVTSYAADIVVDFKDPQNGTGNVKGTMLLQQKPALASDINLSQVTYAGQALPGGVRVILADEVAYVKLDLLKTLVGATKPWVRVDLKQLGDQAGVQQFLSQAQQIDLKSSVALLTASKDVKSVGSETVRGVQTTHYSGTFPVAEALKLLPPESQATLNGQLSSIKDMKFDTWIDEAGLPRKIQLNGAAEGGTFTAALLFTSFDQQLSIAAPPADQVGELPKNMPVAE
ncbi:LppX_LprAFG lipoprotein [Acrocarpospora catenulata]|uniref:LppX_LprAFG lipoprotein n=1 Tax=Acrocarpospora catenulata TaxID=2836182 RepID=UPI001BDA1833|nr:LppX_LprAFG lipoprotein [Acrocarpospora catenulata]